MHIFRDDEAKYAMILSHIENLEIPSLLQCCSSGMSPVEIITKLESDIVNNEPAFHWCITNFIIHRRDVARMWRFLGRREKKHILEYYDAIHLLDCVDIVSDNIITIASNNNLTRAVIRKLNGKAKSSGYCIQFIQTYPLTSWYSMLGPISQDWAELLMRLDFTADWRNMLEYT